MVKEEVARGRPRVIIQSFKYRGWTYSEESIPCSRPACRKCPHGRYWYLRGIVKEHKETFYLGGDLIIVSWEAEGMGGLTFEELYRRRKARKEKMAKKREQEASKRE